MSKATVYDAVPEFGRLRDTVLYDDVWNQPELNKRDRSLVTCAVLAALGKNAELEHHMKLAVENETRKKLTSYKLGGIGNKNVRGRY